MEEDGGCLGVGLREGEAAALDSLIVILSFSRVLTTTKFSNV
jgi:hypothetical protein